VEINGIFLRAGCRSRYLTSSLKALKDAITNSRFISSTDHCLTSAPCEQCSSADINIVLKLNYGTVCMRSSVRV